MSRRTTFSTAARNHWSDSPNAAPISFSTSRNPMRAMTPRRCRSLRSWICSISPTPAPDRTRHILAQDKSIAKKMFAFYGIQSPYFATAYRGNIDHAHDISFPLIVKPTSEDGSIGIDAAAVVTSVKELMERVSYIQTEFDSPALIEEYIEGREIYASILGNYENAHALPLVELDLSKLPKGMPRIASQDVKFEKDTEAYKLTKSAIAEDLDEETVTRLTEIAIKAYHAVKLRDYGRIDMRVSSKGEVYVIEANPNPWLSSGQEFAMAAKKSGLSYTQMISEIVDLAMARHA